MRFLIAVALGSALSLPASLAAATIEPLEVGKPFPNLKLPTLDGTVRSISDFRGKKVILHVFASW